MKKVLSVCLVIALVLSFVSISVNAKTLNNLNQESAVHETVEYLDGGYILKTEITEETSGTNTRANEYVRVGTKKNTLQSSSGEVLWTFTLRGQYDVVEGVSSVCTLASYSHNIYDSSWSLDSASTSKSANKAMASATFKKKILFVTTDTKSINLTLTCDKNGNLS